MITTAMALRSNFFLRGIHKAHGRKFGTAVKVKVEGTSQVCSFRTNENNPINHNAKYVAKMYTVPMEVYHQLFQTGGVPKTFMKQVDTFQECAIMVRQSTIEIMSYFNQSDYTRPINKYVLFGKHGTGKSITLGHILHYAFTQKFIIVNVYWAAHWFKDMKEVTNSVLSPGCIDLPIDAGIWLKHFKYQNLNLLSELDLKVSKDYTWNKRETTSQGTPIIELVDFGLNRMKYACGVVDVLMKELKFASTAGKCKTMVVIDGFNAFTSSHTRIHDDNKAMVLPKQVTLAQSFLDITKSDWCNGAVILTVDTRANKDRRDSHLPRYLLGKEGFEHLDPFVPILINDYTVAEFDTIVEYYKDRKWIRNITPSGQRELELVTNKNPYLIMEQCKFL